VYIIDPFFFASGDLPCPFRCGAGSLSGHQRSKNHLFSKNSFSLLFVLTKSVNLAGGFFYKNLSFVK
jgi:hypothetical protein